MPRSQCAMTAWCVGVPALFALGARLGGDPIVGTAALQGTEHANALAEQQRERAAAIEARRMQLGLQLMLNQWWPRSSALFRY